MRTVVAVSLWLILSGTGHAQTAAPIMKLDAPIAMRLAAVCEGGRSIVAIGGDHDAYVWPLPSGARRPISVGSGRVSRVACNATALAFGFEDGTAEVVNARGIAQPRIDSKDEIDNVAISTDGKLLAVATQNLPVQVWDAVGGKLLWTGVTDFGNTTAVDISHDGNLIITANGDTKIRAYDRKGALVYSVEDDGSLEPFTLSVSADGMTFAVAGAEGTIELHDAATGRQLKKSARPGNTTIGTVAISPDGKDVVALVQDDGYRQADVAIGYWHTEDSRLQQLAVDVSTVVGFGSSKIGLLLLRQESPGHISVDRVQEASQDH
jgi:WD40 repeat protein